MLPLFLLWFFRQYPCAVILLDEVDAIASKRHAGTQASNILLAELLKQMDDLGGKSSPHVVYQTSYLNIASIKPNLVESNKTLAVDF